MKKLVALMLGLMMMLSMSVTGYATEDQTGTTTLTAVVPETTYTINIPADVTLTYGDTSMVTLGEVSVSDVENLPKYSYIVCECYVSALKNEDGDYIPVTYYFDRSGLLTEDDGTKYSGDSQQFQTWSVTLFPGEIGASVAEEDWYTAVPGTYTATMTFKFGIH